MDYDADGDLDILSGSYTGEVYLFERLADGGFAQGVYLRNADGGSLKVGTSITPEAVDMDADGDLDLVIGTRTGAMMMVENVGSRAEPLWAVEGVKMKTAKGETMKGSNAHHADWDGDGLRDVVVGSEWGGAFWYRNTGANDAPVYGERATLVEKREFESRTEVDGPSGSGSRTKVHVTDWNGDGRVDLLMGDVQWLSYELPPLTEEEQAEKRALKPVFKKAEAVYDELVAERNSYVGKEGGIPAEMLARYDAGWDAYLPVAKAWSEFKRKRTRTHGWVWLYLRESSESVSEAMRE